jgi:hypothetical protein
MNSHYHTHTIDKKFIEILVMLIHQQNKQLATIIAEKENLPLHIVNLHVPPTYKIKNMLAAQISSSELSSSVSSSS